MTRQKKQQQQQQSASSQSSDKLQAAITPTRTLMFYTLTASIPIIIMCVLLLMSHIGDMWFIALGAVGFLVSIFGMVRLLYEITLDIAGYPDFTLPVWSVIYLIIYLINAFAFLFFALHTSSPNQYFTGLRTGTKAAYQDALYMSLCNYIGMSPDSSISVKSPVTRFLSVGQGVLAMFVNVVIITKFVNTF